jgi:hypothetical protein
MDGRVDLRRVGVVTAATGTLSPFVVVDGAGVEVEPVTRYLRDLACEVRSLVDEEEAAFWEWSYVEVLRHTGVRAEELVELAHTSIRHYERPNGEVIALLVIAPSKTDRERVIPMSAELFHVIATIVLRQTAHGPIPLVPRYDGHEREWTAPMPYLFQPQIGGVRRVASPATILNNLRKRCQIIGETNPAFRGLHFAPHDFRRLFATDLVNNGLPIHIGAALLGHEHACLRCAQLHVNPKMLPRLDELESDLEERRNAPLPRVGWVRSRAWISHSSACATSAPTRCDSPGSPARSTSGCPPSAQPNSRARRIAPSQLSRAGADPPASWRSALSAA